MLLNLPNIVFPSSEINDMKLKVCGSSLCSKFETEYKEAIVQCTKASRGPAWWDLGWLQKPWDHVWRQTAVGG